MYNDVATIYSYQAVEADDGSDDYHQELTELYTDVPCKLSQYKDLNVNRQTRDTELSLDYRLCCDSTYVIPENSVVLVVHEGQQFKLNTGKRFAYATHQEISCVLVKGAGSGIND